MSDDSWPRPQAGREEGGHLGYTSEREGGRKGGREGEGECVCGSDASTQYA